MLISVDNPTPCNFKNCKVINGEYLVDKREKFDVINGEYAKKRYCTKVINGEYIKKVALIETCCGTFRDKEIYFGLDYDEQDGKSALIYKTPVKIVSNLSEILEIKGDFIRNEKIYMNKNCTDEIIKFVPYKRINLKIDLPTRKAMLCDNGECITFENTKVPFIIKVNGTTNIYVIGVNKNLYKQISSDISYNEFVKEIEN